MEFLLDENVLGLARYLERKVTFRSIGDDNCPSLTASDPEIVKFAKDNDLVIVTQDNKMKKQCRIDKIYFVSLDDEDFVNKIINYRK